MMETHNEICDLADFVLAMIKILDSELIFSEYRTYHRYHTCDFGINIRKRMMLRFAETDQSTRSKISNRHVLHQPLPAALSRSLVPCVGQAF